MGAVLWVWWKISTKKKVLTVCPALHPYSLGIKGLQILPSLERFCCCQVNGDEVEEKILLHTKNTTFYCWEAARQLEALKIASRIILLDILLTVLCSRASLLPNDQKQRISFLLFLRNECLLSSKSFMITRDPDPRQRGDRRPPLMPNDVCRYC